MSDLNNLTQILQKIDEKAATYSALTAYYEGRQPLTFLAPEARLALNNRLTSVSVNIPKLLVDTIGERLRITGISRPDVWADWTANGLDTMHRIAHREALLLGDAYVIAWARPDGTPLVTVESATQMAVTTDPATRQVTSAVKRWEGTDGTHAVWYEPDRITRWTSPGFGATTTGFRKVETLDNPLGVVPVVWLRNGDRLLDRGVSEMADVLSLTDALVKLTTDMLTASEYAARPRRWSSGVELVEDVDGEVVNPFPETDRMMISESHETKFGQLAGADLAGYENAVGVIMRQISAVSGLPEHLLGIGGDNPTSADSIRASEAALTARAEARQGIFGKAWTQVAALMAGVRHGVDPAEAEVSVTWADPSTRSVAQEADAIVKLHAAGILPTTYALARLGLRLHPDRADPGRSTRRSPRRCRTQPAGVGVSYLDELHNLADETEGKVWTVIEHLHDGQITRAEAIALIGAIIGIANRQSHPPGRRSRSPPTSPSARGHRSRPSGRPVVDDVARLNRAAATLLDRLEGTPDPEGRAKRLARSEVLRSASEARGEALEASEMVEGWIRELNGDTCQMCTWWWRGGRVWPKDHPMPRHTGCDCTQTPVLVDRIKPVAV